MDELTKTQRLAWKQAVNMFLESDRAAKYITWRGLTPTQIFEVLTPCLKAELENNSTKPISQALEKGNAKLIDQTQDEFVQFESEFNSLPIQEQCQVIDLGCAVANTYPEYQEFVKRAVQVNYVRLKSVEGTTIDQALGYAQTAVPAQYENLLKELKLVNDQFDPQDNVVPLKATTKPDYSQQQFMTWLMTWLADMDNEQRAEVVNVIFQYINRPGGQLVNESLIADMRKAIHAHHGKVNLLGPRRNFGLLALTRLAGILQLFFKEARDELSQDPSLLTLFNSACADEALAIVNEWRRVCVVDGQLIEAQTHCTREVLLQALQMTQDDFNLVLLNLAEQLGMSTIEDFEPVMREAMVEALSQSLPLAPNTCIHFLVARVKEKLQPQESIVETPESQTPAVAELTRQQMIDAFTKPPTILLPAAEQVTNNPLNQRVGWSLHGAADRLVDLCIEGLQRYLDNLESLSDAPQPLWPVPDDMHKRIVAKGAEQLFQELRQEWFHAWNMGQFKSLIDLNEILAAGEVDPQTYTEIIDQYKHGENGKRLINAYGLEAFNEMLRVEMASVLRIEQFRGSRLVQFATNRLDLKATALVTAIPALDMDEVVYNEHLRRQGVNVREVEAVAGSFYNDFGVSPEVKARLDKNLKRALTSYYTFPEQTSIADLVTSLLEQLLNDLTAQNNEPPRQLRSAAELQNREARGAEPLIPQHQQPATSGVVFDLVDHPSVDDLVEEMLKETEEINIEAIMYQLPKQVQVGDILKATNGALRFKQADTVKIIRKIVKVCAERLVSEQ